MSCTKADIWVRSFCCILVSRQVQCHTCAAPGVLLQGSVEGARHITVTYVWWHSLVYEKGEFIIVSCVAWPYQAHLTPVYGHMQSGTTTRVIVAGSWLLAILSCVWQVGFRWGGQAASAER